MTGKAPGGRSLLGSLGAPLGKGTLGFGHSAAGSATELVTECGWGCSSFHRPRVPELTSVTPQVSHVFTVAAKRYRSIFTSLSLFGPTFIEEDAFDQVWLCLRGPAG